MDRRSFIKLTAVTGTSATLASCGNPENQIIRFIPEDEGIPGVATWAPSVCPLCDAGCGLTVRVMDADADVVRDGQPGVVRIKAAKKLDGGPDHPISRGGLCARGQAAIQVTYHPDRITQPLKLAGDRGSGRYDAVSWDEALALVVSRLDRLERPEQLVVLARGGRSHRLALLQRFTAAFGAGTPVVFDPFTDDVLRRANELSFGRAQRPTFDFAHARYVLSFGADFLGTWNSPVAQGREYGSMRQGRPGIRGRFVQVESRMSQTGANADEWVPAKPGTDGALALGIAHVIMANGWRAAGDAGHAGALIEGWSAGLAGYAPADVERMTGVPAKRVERLARDFAETSPSVALVGGAPLAHTNGVFTALAVNALNALVDGVGTPGGVFFTPEVPIGGEAPAPGRAPSTLDRLSDDPQVVIIDGGANPVFTAPPAWRIRDRLARAPFIVSFGSFLDETSVLADIILPDHSFLESWAEAVPESGSANAVVSVAAPVMRPLYQTRASGDVLLDIARRLQRPLGLPWQTFEDMLKATVTHLPAPAGETATWEAARTRGGWWGEVGHAASASPARRETVATTVRDAGFDGDVAEYPFHFLPFRSPSFLDGSLAHLPWLQEMPDPTTSAMWSSWVEINPATAERMGIATGDVIDITSSQGSVRAGAVITPGIAPDVVAMPAGQGHAQFTRYASGRGANPLAILAPVTVGETGALAWAATRVRVTRIGGPDGRLILFAGGDREHPYEHLGRG